MRHVISLSTVPPRFDKIGHCLQSLLRQRIRPEAIELYIPRVYRRFPQWSGALPAVPDGVTIVRVDEDFGPGTKVIPAARRHRGQDIDILYVDDDHVYEPHWSSRCQEVRKEHPDAVLCGAASTIERMGGTWRADGPEPRAVFARPNHKQLGFRLGQLVARMRRATEDRPRLRAKWHKLRSSGYADIAEGYAGVALRPDFLDDEVLMIPPVLWAVDDIWISGHLARRGVPVWADARLNCTQAVLDVSRSYPLFTAILDGADRKDANLACIDHMRRVYGVWGGTATQRT